MKKNLFLLMTAAALWTACGDNAENTDASASDSTSSINASSDSLASSNTGTDTANTSSSISSQPLDKKSQDFAKEASDAGKLEIELGQLAQTNAADPKVKEFGAMMVKDHTAAAQELQAILAKKNFTPPATEDKHAKHKEDLSKKTGADFDKAYIKMMVDGHKKVVKEFEDAEKNSTDPDVKAFAAKTLPVIRTHLDSAEAIAKAKK